MSDLIDTYRREEGRLRHVIMDAGGKLKGRACKCVFCDDKHPSAGIYQKDNVWRYKCQKCGWNGDVFDVIAKIEGKALESVLREVSGTTAEKEAPLTVYSSIDALRRSCPNLEACYVYSDPETKASQMVVLRYRMANGDKGFWQCRPHGNGFVMKSPAQPWPIYNRARIAAADNVVVVEGEKCVHALHDVGYVATTSPGGAGKAGCADWSPLAGKTVYLWPDHDPLVEGKRKGHEHMRDVMRELEKLTPRPSIYWLDPDELALGDKEDAVDYLESYGAGADSIRCALDLARPVNGSHLLGQRIEDAKAGKLNAVSWPHRRLGLVTRALSPGMVTTICADPGAGKSLFLLDCFEYWHRSGVKAAVYMLEDGQDYHLHRVLAQLDGRADMTDPSWISANPDQADEAYATHRKQLDGMAPWLDATDDPTDYPTLLKWIERRSADGCRVLAIDPITAVPANERPWVEDQKFIMRAKAIVRAAGNSLVLMTHPRLGTAGKGGTLANLAGGAAFPRFAHTVFWIDKHDEPKRARVRGEGGEFDGMFNRTLRIGKARNGPGGGAHLAFNLGPDLRFAEQGLIIPDEEEAAVASPR